MYGAASAKQTWLLVSHPSFKSLKKKLAKNRCFTHETAKRHGNGKWTGNDGLKQTQAYPKAYGRAVFDAWKRITPVQSSDDSSIVGVEFKEMDSEVADLSSIAEWLDVPSDRFAFMSATSWRKFDMAMRRL